MNYVEEYYYMPPSDDAFSEIKECAIKLWEQIATHQSYLDKKINMIKDLKNIKGNFMFIPAMFDTGNQQRLAATLCEKTCKEIRDRLIAGEAPEEYVVF